jgi:uncharacterized protein with GYD domain
MPKYLVSVSYSAEGAKGLRQDGGTKRRQVATHAVEFCFGDRDAVIIADLPDAASAAAVSLAVSSTGAARLTTTPLITPEEMDHAAGKKTAYRAPGA